MEHLGWFLFTCTVVCGLFAKTMTRQKPMGFLPADINLAPELGLALAFSGAQSLSSAASNGGALTSVTATRAAFAFAFGVTFTLVGGFLGRHFGTKAVSAMSGTERIAFGLTLGISALCLYVGVVYVNL